MVGLITQLTGVVGPDHVLTDADMRGPYETDWTRRWHGESLAVVRPGNTEETAAVVAACSAARVSVVPQGGNTGLVGGSVPGDSESVIVSLRRLNSVSHLDTGQIRVEAGATLEEVQEAVTGSGWEVGIDLAARSSATIGGMIATNAGGTRVLRDGMMRRQVLGLSAALASGEVLSSMRGLTKDNTGYDLIGLMCGSEGTLGIVTEAILRLLPARPQRVVALCGVESLAAAAEHLTRVRPHLPSLEAAEYVSAQCMDLVCEHHGLPHPISGHHGAYLLLECAGSSDPADEMSEALDGTDAVAVGTDSASRQRLWDYRESLTESVAALGTPHKLDVTVPTGQMGAFEVELERLVEEVSPGSRLFLFGHIADGGLHINLVTAMPTGWSVDEAVLRLVAEFGGSVSAEHGVGRSKAGALPLTRSASEIAAMRVIKSALDPCGTLNPGVLLSDTQFQDVSPT